MPNDSKAAQKEQAIDEAQNKFHWVGRESVEMIATFIWNRARSAAIEEAAQKVETFDNDGEPIGKRDYAAAIRSLKGKNHA